MVSYKFLTIIAIIVVIALISIYLIKENFIANYASDTDLNIFLKKLNNTKIYAIVDDRSTNKAANITNIFIDYINKLILPSSLDTKPPPDINFQLLKIDNVTSTGNKYVLALSLYLTQLTYIKNIILTCTIGTSTLTINNIDTTNVIDPTIKPILPSLNSFNSLHLASTNNNIPEYLNQINNTTTIDGSMCFNTTNNLFNQSDCLTFGGVWDKPVISPNDCPFYLANKNYTNQKGGVRYGYCDMPAGTKPISYRFVDSSIKPICYNC